MNQMKWMMILPLVLVLASARAQAQIPSIQPGIRSGDIDPRLQPGALNEPRIDPKLLFDSGQLSRSLGQRESSKAREWKSPAWACWQSALGLVTLSFVIGFLYGRFGPSD
jgi:hypothetical protein